MKRRKTRKRVAFLTVLISCIGILEGTAYGARPSRQVTVTSEVMFGGEDDFEPDDIHEEGGVLYRLQSWKMEPVETGPCQKEVKQQILYEAMEDRDAIPEFYEITAENDKVDQRITEKFPIIDLKEKDERWSDGFSFPVVFHAYGAEYYQLGSRKVPLDVEHPALDDCEAELLEEIGVSADRYKIREIAWEGAPYYDENGVLCRNAVAAGEKLVTDYLVTYGGMVTFPGVQGYQCRAVYQLPVLERETAMEKNILPEHAPDPVQKAEPVWLITRQTVMITISLLLVVFIILAFVWLIRRLVEKRGEIKREGGYIHEITGNEKT